MQRNKVVLFGFQINKFNMLIAFTIVLILCVSTIQAAPTETTETTETMLPPIERQEIKYCTEMAPCGWAVYIPETRKPHFFVKNTCYCALDKQCSRQEDHLSVGAYVYRCVDKPSTTTEKIEGVEQTQT